MKQDRNIEVVPAPAYGDRPGEHYEYGIRRRKDGYFLRGWMSLDEGENYEFTPSVADSAIFVDWDQFITSPEVNRHISDAGDEPDSGYEADEGYEIVRRPFDREDAAPGD